MFSSGTAVLLIFLVVIIGIILQMWKNSRRLKAKLNEIFPEAWRDVLKKRVAFYAPLNDADKNLFEKRVQRFLATKIIEAVDTEIDDTVRLMVASSAIIPTFAFPDYNYPNVRTILIYPNSFNEKYQTETLEGNEKRNILGMVGNNIQNATVILSKPDLVSAFDGLPHKENVGIHEFVHMLDKADGDIDGIPEALLQHQYVAPWLREIKSEMSKIEKGTSDINPYALTNNAEFLAVVSEYFFDNPEKFERKHAELYKFLSNIYKGDKDAPSDADNKPK